MNESRPPMSGLPGQPPRLTPHPPPVRPGIAPPPTIRQAPASPHVPGEKDLEPISLIEEPVESATTLTGTPAPKKIQAFGGSDVAHKKHDWKRQPTKNGTGAVRVKSFHGKYSEQGIEYLDNAINEWLDAHPDVEIKFVTPTVMTFEGKIREPALVLNLWY